MARKILFLIAVVVGTVAAVTNAVAAPPVPVTPTITLTDPANAYLGGTVHFESVYDAKLDSGGDYKHSGPRVEVLCSIGGILVFGGAQSAHDADYSGVLLGGAPPVAGFPGGSVWWNEHAGEAADCVANLYVFDKVQGQQTYVLLAATSFNAAGG